MRSDISVKILFLAADPSNAPRLRLMQELRDIKESLRLGNYQLEQREAVRVEDFSKEILYVKPNIVHFFGHGTPHGELCFENKVGEIQFVKPDALAATFKMFKQHVNCVVLNACYSRIPAKAIAEHIPFAIGMNDEITDEAAIAFSVGFYEALAAKRSIEDAHKFGCLKIQQQGISEHLKPLIFIKEVTPPPEKPIINPFIPINGRVEDRQKFFGREQEIRWVFETLNSGSSVALIGNEGIGKSSLLLAICREAESRLQPPRQPVFLDLNGVDNEKDFYGALCYEVGIPDCTGYMLNRNLKNKRVLLALDNVGKFNWQGFTRQVRDMLRGLAEGNDAPLKLILAATQPLDDLFNDSHDQGRTSPLAGICQEEHIKPWDEATIRAFIDNRLARTSVSFTEEEIIQLVHKSRGHPRQLVQLCYDTYRQYINH
ncbi:CHAT domain-containing protein [Aetokthonos hydrillicola Thurmond2011]|jgi:GTPase SAR1 family protein|uniref:CHAT domain-containing protein n=1 Tax=Aetokthonos hydrillicola Thurmond2011 TaxID=2712845 RepID=A0AAP5IGN3_9CYAN|nr:AAA family ATPase [Aetokthonos hydrillicola]MBO3464161.1 CHAT domain-containing protein [Aetokthonos hydrillicola CCALA 1050]MBW4590995.1 CHAT domain-containing protein [Aetokthonos hydrillicola CCALA 1050]MDR9900309.1 CHAT domain-containing protein [Aetokthonos hydrillicola Thurmond2011]